jgi:hypothetical protein
VPSPWSDNESRKMSKSIHWWLPKVMKPTRRVVDWAIASCDFFNADISMEVH